MRGAVVLLALVLLSACSSPPGDGNGGSGGADGSGAGGSGGVDCADRSGAERELLGSIRRCAIDDECELVQLEELVPAGVCIACGGAVRIDRDVAAFEEAALGVARSFQQCGACGISSCDGAPGGGVSPRALCLEGLCPAVYVDDCAYVIDRTFHSVEELEVGMGPLGVVLGRWSITAGAGLPRPRHRAPAAARPHRARPPGKTRPLGRRARADDGDRRAPVPPLRRRGCSR